MARSLTDINQEFTRRLQQATDDEKPAVEREHMAAQLQYYAERETERALADAKVAALAKYPEAKGLEVMITGTDPETIEAQAKAVHEFVAARAATAQPPTNPPPGPPPPAGGLTPEQMAAARQAYGTPGVGVGTPPVQQDNEQAEIFRKMVGDGGGKNRSSTKYEAERYLSRRTQEVMKVMRQNPGQWIGMKTGIRTIPGE